MLDEIRHGEYGQHKKRKKAQTEIENPTNKHMPLKSQEHRQEQTQKK